MQNTQCLQAGEITSEGVTADFDKGDKGWAVTNHFLVNSKYQVHVC